MKQTYLTKSDFKTILQARHHGNGDCLVALGVVGEKIRIEKLK